MLYCSQGPLKMRIREGMLMFCNFLLEQSPTAVHPRALKELLEKTPEHDFTSKFKGCLPKIFELMSESRKTIGANRSIRVTVNKREIWVNAQKIKSVQLFYSLGGETGVNLNITSDKMTYISFRLAKVYTAQKLAQMANLPEPVVIPDWPLIDPNETNKGLSGADVLEFLEGTNIPVRDLAEFAQKYTWKKQ